MALQVGARVGPYEVTGVLGAGGMGEVYRARDTRLKREVALKILPETFAADPDRLARFQREAEVLAALNHPHIAAIHGFEDAGGTRALVLELVEGETLADRIARGPIPIDEVLPIAKQIAEALEAAHERGIIHRDLKPANIKVTADGVVKVLDFGLAKLSDASPAASSSAALSRSPTITSPAMMTGVGALLGTAAYMSPEQARGRAADHRADIWAFGLVLYEMLTGRRGFDGEDISITLASVLKEDVKWDALPAGLPMPVRRLLRRCLEKDPRRRLGAIGDARLELEDAMAGAEPAGAAPGTRAARSPWALLAMALLSAGIASVLTAWVLARPAPAASPLERFVLQTSADAPPFFGGNPLLAISPDGAVIVFRVGRNVTEALYVRRRGELEPSPLSDTARAAYPFFSPDGQWIGYLDTRDSTLKRISVAGGLPQTITALDDPIRGASWGDDGQIVFSSVGGGLLRVAAAGGEPEAIATLASGSQFSDYRWPHLLPGGQGVLFTAWGGTADRSEIRLLQPDGTEVTLLTGGSFPLFVPGGYLAYMRGGTLRVARFNAADGRIDGEAVPVVEGIGMTPTGGAHIAIARDGTLVYGTGRGGIPPRTLVWVDRQGNQEPINVPPRAYTYARLSPDGTRVALDARDEQSDIWIWDLRRETLQRLTTDPGPNRVPVWTSDGRHVAYTAVKEGVDESIYWRAADGSGAEERLSTGSGVQAPYAFSPDGRRLVLSPSLNAPYDLLLMNLDGDRTPVPLLNSTFSEENAELSPDGRWMAYQSNETGTAEVYIVPFPDVRGGKQQASSGGGSRPKWSRDGRELYYYVEPATIMAVSVTPGSALTLGRAAAVVKGPFAAPANTGRHYDVSPDGRRFLLLRDVELPEAEQPSAPDIRVVLNWGAELARLLPAR
jgi:serine/threonine-protein kinase